jgi:hypothetical protein
MSKRGRGRPPKTERDATGELLWFERFLGEETASLRGRKPTKALIRAAIRLGVSERVAWRLLAELRRGEDEVIAAVASLGALLRELDDRFAQEK